jgi:hypothetical protein
MARYVEAFDGSRPHVDEPHRSRESADARLAERIGVWTGLGWALSKTADGAFRLTRPDRAALVLRVDD